MNKERVREPLEPHPVEAPRTPFAPQPERGSFPRYTPQFNHYRSIGNQGVRQLAENGHDFSDVVIHKNSAQATQVGAVAYTQGNDIHFAPGAYNPGTSAGKQLLGHELAHVVQQRQGRV